MILTIPTPTLLRRTYRACTTTKVRDFPSPMVTLKCIVGVITAPLLHWTTPAVIPAAPHLAATWTLPGCRTTAHVRARTKFCCMMQPDPFLPTGTSGLNPAQDRHKPRRPVRCEPQF